MLPPSPAMRNDPSPYSGGVGSDRKVPGMAPPWDGCAGFLGKQMAVEWVREDCGVSSQQGGQVGERQTAPTLTPSRACGDIWKDDRRTGGGVAQQRDRVSCELRLCVRRGSGDCPQQFLQTDRCDWSAPPSRSSTGLAHSGDQTHAPGAACVAGQRDVDHTDGLPRARGDSGCLPPSAQPRLSTSP